MANIRSNLRRITSALLLIGSISSCSPSWSEVYDHVDQHNQDRQKSLSRFLRLVSVSIADEEGDSIIGSGVILVHQKGKRLVVLTARHVVTNEPLPVVLHPTSEKIPAEIVSISSDPAIDLAIVQSVLPMTSSGPEAKIPLVGPDAGDSLWIIGAPNSNIGNITSGLLSKKIERLGTTVAYRTDAAIYPGNSGGGVFDTNGLLIGIVTSFEMHIVWGVIPGGGHLVSWDIIKRYLKKELPGFVKAQE